MGRELLFVGGPLHGRLMPVPDSDDFEPPIEGSPVYMLQKFEKLDFMVAEGEQIDHLDLRDAMRTFFWEAARRSEEG